MTISPQHIKSLNDTTLLGHFNAPITGASIDSRTTKPGNLFIAFKGQTADGHSYIPNAISHGAAAVMASVSWGKRGSWDDSLPLILSHNPEKSLGELAKLHRQSFSIPVIGITGSNGKTTTKDLLSHILKSRFKVLATKGNFNNQLGLPLSLLDIDETHEIAVVEMGASKPNDIIELCEIAQPTMGLITNITHAHTEFFSRLDGVLSAKKALFDAIPANGTIFLNADDDLLRGLKINHPNIISFGQKYGDKRFSILDADNNGHHQLAINGLTIRLQIPGKAFALNLAAVWFMANHMGISDKEIQASLETFEPTPGRMELIHVNQFHFIHDAYNANPQSMKSALATFANMTSEASKILVLADMLELGRDSEKFHAELLPYIKRSGAKTVFLVGKSMSALASSLETSIPNIFTGNDVQQLSKQFIENVNPHDLILLKGSNSFGLGQFITLLKES